MFSVMVAPSLVAQNQLKAGNALTSIKPLQPTIPSTINPISMVASNGSNESGMNVTDSSVLKAGK